MGQGIPLLSAGFRVHQPILGALQDARIGIWALPYGILSLPLPPSLPVQREVIQMGGGPRLPGSKAVALCRLTHKELMCRHVPVICSECGYRGEGVFGWREQPSL